MLPVACACLRVFLVGVLAKLAGCLLLAPFFLVQRMLVAYNQESQHLEQSGLE